MASGKEEKKEDKGEEKEEKGKEKQEEKKEDKGKEKEEKGKEKQEEKGKEKDEKKEGSDVINAIYKVNLHCQQCGRKIKKHLLVTQGVQSVETDMEKGEIKVKGKLEPLKILKLIEKTSNKKVELISPKIKLEPPKEKPKEIKKEPIIRTITAKVHMHCDKCERDLKNRLIKHRGIFSVKTDKEAEIVTIEGSMEPERLLRFLKRKVHKNAEIISSKEQKKVEDKEKGKQEEKSKAGESTKEKGEGKSSEPSKEKEKEKNKDGEPEKKDKGEEKSGEPEKKDKGEEKSIIVASTKEKEKEIEIEIEKKKEGGGSETTQIIQIQEDTKVEIVAKQNVPYIIHYVYAPQLFSDENPNACSIS